MFSWFSHDSLRSIPLAALFVVSLIGGCGPNTSLPISHDQINNSESYLPVVSGADLKTLVRRGDRPLLVEFGVNTGCYRCDQMRPEMTRLARDFEGRADVVRVDFNVNRQLADQFGTTICPSYVLLDQGEVLAKRSFPTSADMLAADLSSALANDAHGR